MKFNLLVFFIILFIIIFIVVKKTQHEKSNTNKLNTTIRNDDEIVYSDSDDRLVMNQPIYDRDLNITNTRLIQNFGGAKNKWKAHMALRDGNPENTPCWQLCNFVKFIRVDVQFHDNGNILNIKHKQGQEKAAIHDGDYVIIAGDDGYYHQFGVLGPSCSDQDEWSPCFSQDNGLFNETKNENGQTVIDWEKSPPVDRFAIHQIFLFDQSDSDEMKPLLKEKPFYIKFIKFSDNSPSPFEGSYLNIIENTGYHVICNTGQGRLSNLLGYWDNADNWNTSTFVLRNSSVQLGNKDIKECVNCSAQFTTSEKANICG